MERSPFPEPNLLPAGKPFFVLRGKSVGCEKIVNPTYFDSGIVTQRAAMDVAKLFDDLESNNLDRVDEVKRKFQEIFSSSKYANW